MKSTLLYCVLACLFTITFNGTAQTLAVAVRDVKNSKGMVRIALYNSEKDFMKTMWRAVSVQAIPGEIRAAFEDIPPGTYAISVVHDANGNDKMDSNAMGIPKEGFGFSNDAQGTFGPPSFEEAKFVWDGRKRIEIRLKYF